MRTAAHAGRLWLERVRGRLVIGIVLIVGLYFVVAFGEQAWKARQLQQEVVEREATIARMEQQRDDLQQQLDEYASEDRYLAYVERIARRDLNLAHPGETVLLVRWLPAPTPTPAPTVTPDPRSGDGSNWRRWVELFAGG